MPLRLARWVPVLATLTALSATAPAAAEPAAGLTGVRDLVLFDTANPGAATARPIAGLQSETETAVGLDRRPATGELMLITVPTGVLANGLVRTYTLDPATATATFVGSIPGTVP